MRYSPADHQRAFELWLKHGGYSGVIDEMDITYTTLSRWAAKDFGCTCPWHDWNKLFAEREAALQAKAELLQQGDLDPIHHHIAIAKAIEDAEYQEGAHVQMVLDKLVRSDLERLGIFEAVFSKVVYALLGLATDPETGVLVAKGGDVRDELLDRGLKFNNAEGALRAMVIAQGQIDSLKHRLGLVKEDFTPITAAERIEEGAEKAPLSIQDLRALKNGIQNTDPAMLNAMMQQVQNEQEVIKIRPQNDDSDDTPSVGQSAIG